MFSKILSFGLAGLNGFVVDVEVDTNLGKPCFDIVGLPDAVVKESAERVHSAIKNSGLKFPLNRITVNLAPANVKKIGAIYDLPISIALLVSSGQITGSKSSEFMILGELGLNGKIKPIIGVLPALVSARQLGYKKFIIPKANENEASYISGIEVYAFEELLPVVQFLNGFYDAEPIKNREWKPVEAAYIGEDFSRVKGQKIAKRATEIAAAGSHNMLMVGPPGAGKTMIARCIPSILPNLTFEEALEITKIHSVAGVLDLKEGIVQKRPFRSPHHTASSVAITGGGKDAKPGEVSLASGGVLFLDELPEYTRATLETLRQPLEDGVITVSRASGSYEYPANIMLVASMNPCPCGNYGSKTATCTCSAGKIQAYLKRLSGPLLDRIDIKIDVERVDFSDISNKTEEESSEVIKERVERARQIQRERFKGTKVNSNSKMTSKMIEKFCVLDDSSKELVKLAFEKYHISARGYTRVLKVARTIADLAGSENISFQHVAEALAYRNIDKFNL